MKSMFSSASFYVILVILSIETVYGTSNFNYEVARNTHTAIRGVLTKISLAISLPAENIMYKKHLVVNDLLEPAEKLHFLVDYIFPLFRVYSVDIDVSALNFASDKDGNFLSYGLMTGLPYGMGAAFTDPRNYFGDSLYGNRMYLHTIDKFGYPDSPFFNFSYDPRYRPWYLPVKANPVKQWSPVYLDATTGKPCLTLVQPLFNETEHGNHSFIGTVACDLYLSGVSNFLENQYYGSDRIVFIIDKETNYLIGNSLSVPNYGVDENGVKYLISAVDSSNILISGSVSMLIEAEWPDYLLIFKDNYLQSLVYTDDVQGLSWRIVIMMPAEQSIDTVHVGSSYAKLIYTFTSFAMFTSVFAICLILFHWKTRLVGLSQPLFTLIMLFGSIALCIHCIFLIGDSGTKVCQLRPFLFNFSFTLAIAPVLIKSVLVYFASQRNVQKLIDGPLIHPIKLAWLISGLLVIDLAILMIMLFVVGGKNGKGTDPVTVVKLTNNGAYSQLTRCAYTANNSLALSEIFFKGTMITISCLFAYLNRKIPGAIAGSREQMISSYNIALSGVAVIIVQTSLNDLVAGIVAQVVGICLCVILTIILLIGPIMYTLYTVGDSSALADVELKLREEANLVKLKRLPVHNAIVSNASVQEIISKIEEYPETIFERVDDKGIFDYALGVKADKIVILALMEYLLPYTTDKEPIDSYFHGFAWALLSQQDDYVDVVRTILDEYAPLCFLLAEARDAHGRTVLNIASPKCREEISKATYFLQRYQLTTSIESPHYQTATTLVHLAIDHDSEDKCTIALKFMRHGGDFIRCCFANERGLSSSQYFLPILSTYRCSNEEMSFKFAKHGFADYPHCIVYPAGNRNLAEVIASESHDKDEFLKVVGIQVLKAMHYMHEKGLIHGDIRPQNILRMGAQWLLIDLDSSALIDSGYAGIKTRSAYSPPELIYVDGGKAALRSLPGDEDGELIVKDLPYDLVSARPSHDCWALGVVFFRLLSGEPLFLSNTSDDIDNHQLIVIGNHDLDWIDAKLEKIEDPVGRNLVSQMLNFDPTKRPSMEQLMLHPFFTGRSVARMLGETAEYDVFISYRVASDAAHASMLFDLLTARGLKVWWDKRCLLAGENWESGFCDGLVKSLVFVALLSAGAINNGQKANQNFGMLKEDSPCDNVLLEHRLALDLRRRGLLSKIYPIMIGEYSEELGVYSGYTWPDLGPVSSIVVDAVEKKLREHLGRQCLGSSLLPKLSVKGSMDLLTKNQGYFICGNRKSTFEEAASLITEMVSSTRASLLRGSIQFENSPRRSSPRLAFPLPKESELRRLVSRRVDISEGSLFNKLNNSLGRLQSPNALTRAPVPTSDADRKTSHLVSSIARVDTNGSQSTNNDEVVPHVKFTFAV